MTLKKSVILSMAYFPPVQYFSAILEHEIYLIEKFENYTKQTYRNRCTIGSANGPLDLVIPVKKTSPGKTPVTEVKIDNDYRWQKLHWRALVSAYRNSPFFEFYEEEFRPFYNSTFENLFDYNLHLLETVLSLLEIDKQPRFTNKFMRSYSYDHSDLRHSIHPKKSISGFHDMPYSQVFMTKHGFIPGLSIADLLFNTGPAALEYLSQK